MKIRCWFFFAGCMAVSACQTTYTAPTGKPSANIVVDAGSDSSSTTGGSFNVFAFADDVACKASPHGKNLGTTVFSDGTETYGPISVPAAERFTFAVRYIESRMAQNRDCSFTASFVPEPDHSYLVRFRSVADVSSCSLTVDDQTAGRSVSLAAPQYSCVASVAGRPKNGQAGHLQFEVEAKTDYARNK